MRLLVPLCKHCKISRKTCVHYHLLHGQTIAMKMRGTLSHHCPVYYEILKVGQRVRVELKQIEKYDSLFSGEPEEPCAEWVSAGHATGIIDENYPKIKGFYLIKLDEPVDLCYPQGSDWLEAKEVHVTHTRRRLNEIEIIDDSPAAEQPTKDAETT